MPPITQKSHSGLLQDPRQISMRTQQIIADSRIPLWPPEHHLLSVRILVRSLSAWLSPPGVSRLESRERCIARSTPPMYHVCLSGVFQVPMVILHMVHTYLPVCVKRQNFLSIWNCQVCARSKSMGISNLSWRALIRLSTSLTICTTQHHWQGSLLISPREKLRGSEQMAHFTDHWLKTMGS